MSARTPPLLVLALVIALALGLTLAGAGCTGRVGYTAAVGTTPARLVQVGPDVWVVEGRTDPVFYSGDYYWRYQDGIWLRSPYYDGGFVQVRYDVVPPRVRTIDRPRRFIEYRAPSRAPVRVIPPRHYLHRRETYERRPEYYPQRDYPQRDPRRRGPVYVVPPR